jgi:hypothetical protein
MPVSPLSPPYSQQASSPYYPPRESNVELAESKAAHGELPGEDIANIPELSPDPERNAINMPKRASASNWAPTNAGTAFAAEGSEMRPNLDLGAEPNKNGIGSRDTQLSNRTHIMSFMDFDENTKTPAR